MLPALLWYFLPSQITHALLPHLSTHLPALFPPASRNTPAYARNYRHAYTALVIGYLAYTAWQAEKRWGDDYYAVLGVSRGEGDDGLRRAFRSLSRTYHPDRATGAEAHFIHIRQAYEVLTDPVKRYAYDRFGPDIVGWRNVASVKEYMHAGLMHSVAFYVFSGGVMLLLSVTGRATAGSYWRYTLFAILLTLELTLILSPTAPSHLSPLFPQLSRYLPLPRSWINTPQFIWISRLHQIWTSLSVAIAQLAGVWQDPVPIGDELAKRVSALVRSIEAEAVSGFHGEVVPVLSKTNDPLGAQETLLGHIEQLMLDQSVSSHPVVRDALQTALARPTTAPAQSVHTYPANDGAALTSSSHPSRLRSYVSELELARSIPLPPSPPPSPRPRQRSLR